MKTATRNVIALDLGVGSIGYCLAKFDGETLVDTLNGSHIISNDESSYNEGKFVSSTKKRTLERGARKTKTRKKNNKRKVANLLSILGYDNKTHRFDNLHLLKIKALTGKVGLPELSAILYSYASHRGYNELTDINHEDNQKGGLKDVANSLKKECDDMGITISEYFQRSDKNIRRNNIFPNSHILQEMYVDELRKIYTTQQKYHKELTQIFLEKIINQIYFRLPLKSVREMKNDCIFENKRKVTPIANPLFQEYRAWSAIHNLRITSHNIVIPNEIKQHIFDTLKTKENLTRKEITSIIQKQLSIKNITINDMTIKGLTTFIRIKKCGYDIYGNVDKTNVKPFGVCWEDVYSNINLSKYGINDNVHLEKTNSSLSNKAIAYMLPYMNGEKDFLNSYEAEQICYPKKDTNMVSKSILDLKYIQKNTLKNPVVTKIINCAINIIKKLSETHHIDEIKIEMIRAMTTPSAKREQLHKDNKKREIVNNIVKKLIETNFNVSSESIKNINKVKMWLEQADVSVHFSNLAVLKNVDVSVLTSYCLYSGKVIPFKSIFDSNIDIEHTIPKSRIYDDSFENTTLAYRDYNQNKGRYTAFEYFEVNDITMRELSSFSYRKMKNFKYADPKYVSSDNDSIDISEKSQFAASSLNNTAYIAKYLVSHIKDYFGKVSVTNGSITNEIRNMELMDGENVHFSQVLSGENFPLYLRNDKDIRKRKTKRDDNRHHALDAFIIAITSEKHKQMFSKIGKHGDNDMNGIKQIREDIIKNILGGQHPKDYIDNILIPLFKKMPVNIKKEKSIIYKKKVNGVDSLCVRGNLFGATIYGKRKIDGVEIITSRSRIDAIRYCDIDDIIDDVTREIIKNIVKPFEDIIKGKEKENLFNFVNEKTSNYYGELNFNTNFKINIPTFNIVDSQNNVFKRIKLKVCRKNDSHVVTKGGIYSGNTNVMCVIKKENGKLKTETVTLNKLAIVRRSNADVKKEFYKDVIYKIKTNDYFVLGHSKQEIEELIVNGKTNEFMDKLFYVTETSKDGSIKTRPHHVGRGGKVLIYNEKNGIYDEKTGQAYYKNMNIGGYIKEFNVLTKVKIDILGNIIPLSSFSNTN